MGIEVTCSQGHPVYLDSGFTGREVRCPRCDALVEIENCTPPFASDTRESAAKDSAAAGDKLHGLWQIMQQGSASGERAGLAKPTKPVEPAIQDSPEHSPEQGRELFADAGVESGHPPASKGLWAVMSGEPTAGNRDNLTGPPEGIASDISGSRPAFAKSVAQLDRSKNGLISFWLGCFTVPLAGFSLFPGVWTMFPATIVGFSALTLGVVAMGEIQRSRSRRTGKALAVAGMALGVVGMFLGPLWFFGISRP
jgi:hypothetical protein